jgi:hypothetical protein
MSSPKRFDHVCHALTLVRAGDPRQRTIEWAMTSGEPADDIGVYDEGMRARKACKRGGEEAAAAMYRQLHVFPLVPGLDAAVIAFAPETEWPERCGGDNAASDRLGVAVYLCGPSLGAEAGLERVDSARESGCPEWELFQTGAKVPTRCW